MIRGQRANAEFKNNPHLRGQKQRLWSTATNDPRQYFDPLACACVIKHSEEQTCPGWCMCVLKWDNHTEACNAAYDRLVPLMYRTYESYHAATQHDPYVRSDVDDDEADDEGNCSDIGELATDFAAQTRQSHDAKERWYRVEA